VKAPACKRDAREPEFVDGVVPLVDEL